MNVPEEPEKATRSELLQEYYWAHRRIGEFDQQQVTIKSWSASAAAALFAGVFVTQDKRILFIACAAALVFWYIDALWKSFQLISVKHALLLEEHLAQNSVPPGPTYGTRHQTEFELGARTKRFIGALGQVNVFLPHAPMAAAALLLYFLLPPNF